MASYDVVIVGAGIAGLQAARFASPLKVLVLENGPSASSMALGGVAAPANLQDVDQHILDTLETGEGLCDEYVVDRVIRQGLRALDELESMGFEFDFGMNHEGGHRLARVRRKGGDQTGRHLTEFLRSSLASNVELRHADLSGILVQEWGGRVGGVVIDADPGHEIIRCNQVVLATGGIGARFDATSNPPTALGRGLELAARCGATLRDLEFIQYHPTTLDLPITPRPLISEALRGAGGVLRDQEGHAIMADHPQRDLAPRDVVARRVEEAHNLGGCFLDLEAVEDLSTRFPSAFKELERACVDPARVPIRPAVHYHMGGVMVDHNGATSLPGLWACGEVASTGLHGANRLASNSLLEALVYGESVGRALTGRIEASARCEKIIWTSSCAPSGFLSRCLGLTRRHSNLVESLNADLLGDDVLARLMIESALARKESRGGHFRDDFPEKSAVGSHSVVTWKNSMESEITPTEVRTRPHLQRSQRA